MGIWSSLSVSCPSLILHLTNFSHLLLSRLLPSSPQFKEFAGLAWLPLPWTIFPHLSVITVHYLMFSVLKIIVSHICLFFVCFHHNKAGPCYFFLVKGRRLTFTTESLFIVPWLFHLYLKQHRKERLIVHLDFHNMKTWENWQLLS